MEHTHTHDQDQDKFVLILLDGIFILTYDTKDHREYQIYKNKFLRWGIRLGLAKRSRGNYDASGVWVDHKDV